MTREKTMRHKAGMVRNSTVKLGYVQGNVYRCINPSLPRAKSIGLVVASKAYQKKNAHERDGCHTVYQLRAQSELYRLT
jgi:translation initiation factor 2 gamma subunit (eIF-2gamma)